MQSQGLQAMIKHIFSDVETKNRFLSNPDGVIGQYQLSEQEKKAVLSTTFKLGLVSGNSAQLTAVLNNTIEWLAPEA